MAERLSSFIDLVNAASEALWQFAIAMSLQVAVLVAILAALDLVLLRRLRASLRYAVWTLVLIKLVLPVSLASPVSLARWLPSYGPPASADPADAPSDASSAAASAQMKAAETAPGGSSRTGEPPLRLAPAGTEAILPHDHRATTIPSETLGGVGREKPTAPRVAEAQVTAASLHWKSCVLMSWLAVVAVLLAILLRRFLHVRRIVDQSTPPPDNLQQLLTECIRTARLRGNNIRLRVSPDLGSPAICGFWRATILIPETLVGTLAPARMRLVLAHELAHWRRFDLQVNCLQAVLQILYFFHPLVWLANAVLRRLREQAVDEAVLVMLGTPADEYSSTLLDIASYPRRRAELALRLVGVVESHKALGGRIKRLVTRPLPKKAKLGVAGLTTVLLFGFVLLPMAANEGRIAVQESSPAADENEAAEPKASKGEAEDPAVRQDEQPPALSGRIVDDTGAPVNDAEITITGGSLNTSQQTKTDAEGRYAFQRIHDPGEYRIRIESPSVVGLTRRDTQPIVHLTPDGSVQRDLELQRACRVMVRVVDEQGNPVRNVAIRAADLAGDPLWQGTQRTPTDKLGIAIVGGLAPSSAEYILAAEHDDFAIEKATLTVDDPEQLVSCDFVLRKGETVRGTAVCSDGQPPAGWRILALPSWWQFASSPVGTVIEPDGSFELPHIVPGKYDVTISIPSGESGLMPKKVLQEAELAGAPEPLAVKLDHPSPASMVYITGQVRFDGPPPATGFWIFARSDDRAIHSSASLRAGQNEFRIGPVPPGEYTLQVQDVAIKKTTIRVQAPADDVVLRLAPQGRPHLTGAVIDSETGQPVTDFRLRIMKVQTLSGANFAQGDNWRSFQNAQGVFDVEVVGPGVYIALVAAEGFAWTRSEPINTVENAGKPIEIALARGVSITGTVVDEQGVPVDGAHVLPLPGDVGRYARAATQRALNEGVKTVGGRFVLENLPAEETALLVTHPDYCFAIAENVLLKADGQEVPAITLTRGGTVRGHVYDAQGRPQPGVALHFVDEAGQHRPETGQLATAVTDENGYYVAQHLPEQLCYAIRAEEWSTLGVIRHAILPRNGETQTLDFGGQTRLAGRLLLNGEPLVGGRLVLADHTPHHGIFKSNAQTATDGSFTFRGIPPGDRTLYYALPGRPTGWGKVRTIQVTREDADLGNIDHRTTRLVVLLKSSGPVDPSLRLRLEEYSPIWAFGDNVGVVASVEEPANVRIIKHVPTGRHELVIQTSQRLELRQLVDVTADDTEQTLEISLPRGTASLSGHIDEQVCPRNYALKLWSADGRLRAYMQPNEEGNYRVDHLPAGDYVIREKDMRNAPVLIEVSLAEGEQRTLDLTPENVAEDASPYGYLRVHVLTKEGIPLPCDVELIGPEGKLTPHTKQYGKRTFLSRPGEYRLNVDYPGFQRHRETVELQPLGANGRPAPKSEHFVYLEESP